jgi:argininosuccinate lyase
VRLAHHLLAYVWMLDRDRGRLAQAIAAAAAESPLGSGALSGVGFPIDRRMTAAELGFGAPAPNSLDAVAGRDALVDYLHFAAQLGVHLSRLGAEIVLWSSEEFGFVELDDAFSSVSSIMPQKKNPQGLEHVKAVAGMAIGTLNTVLACAKNTALADVNGGVTAPHAPALETIERATKALLVFDGTLRTLSVRPEVMRRAAEIGFGTATELADIIVRETGLSFRMAHNIVGRVVRETIEAGKTAAEIVSADLDAAATALFGRSLDIPEEVVRKALDPAENLKTRSVTGGPAPERMAEMLAQRSATLAQDLDAIAAVRRRVAAADAELDAAVLRALAAAGPDGDADRRGGRHGQS